MFLFIKNFYLLKVFILLKYKKIQKKIPYPPSLGVGVGEVSNFATSVYDNFLFV